MSFTYKHFKSCLLGVGLGCSQLYMKSIEVYGMSLFKLRCRKRVYVDRLSGVSLTIVKPETPTLWGPVPARTSKYLNEKGKMLKHLCKG